MSNRALTPLDMPWLQHSKEWWLAATLSTLIPVIYSFSGGMRASIMTDTTQVGSASFHLHLVLKRVVKT